MTPEVIEKYNAKTAGGKYILNPNMNITVVDSLTKANGEYIVA